MQTQVHEINEVVGLPLDHSFGADYLQRFPIASDLHVPVMCSIGYLGPAIGNG